MNRDSFTANDHPAFCDPKLTRIREGYSSSEANALLRIGNSGGKTDQLVRCVQQPYFLQASDHRSVVATVQTPFSYSPVKVVQIGFVMRDTKHWGRKNMPISVIFSGPEAISFCKELLATVIRNRFGETATGGVLTLALNGFFRLLLDSTKQETSDGRLGEVA